MNIIVCKNRFLFLFYVRRLILGLLEFILHIPACDIIFIILFVNISITRQFSLSTQDLSNKQFSFLLCIRGKKKKIVRPALGSNSIHG